MSVRLSESELEVLRRSILEFYEAVNTVVCILEDLKYLVYICYIG